MQPVDDFLRRTEGLGRIFMDGSCMAPLTVSVEVFLLTKTSLYILCGAERLAADIRGGGTPQHSCRAHAC